MPPEPAPKPKTETMYELVKVYSTFGPFTYPHRFSRDTLAALSPLPKSAEGIDHKEHVDAIIRRGLALGVIVEVPDAPIDSESPKPPGIVGEPKNYGAAVDKATQAVIDQRAASSQAVQARPAENAPPPADKPPVQQGGLQPLHTLPPAVKK